MRKEGIDKFISLRSHVRAARRLYAIRRVTRLEGHPRAALRYIRDGIYSFLATPFRWISFGRQSQKVQSDDLFGVTFLLGKLGMNFAADHSVTGNGLQTPSCGNA